MSLRRRILIAIGFLIALPLSVLAEQQVLYPPTAMPRVDMHTHMDAKTQYAKCVGAMDLWGGTITISLAGLYVHNSRQPAHYTVSKARAFYIKYRDRILFGTDVFGADETAAGFLSERKLLETTEVTSGMHRGPQMEGFNLPHDVLNHIYYWNAARLIPRVRQVLEARKFKIGYELGRFKFDRLPPDVTVNRLTVDGQVADLTGTLGSVTESLTVEIRGKAYAGIDNMNGTWKLPGKEFASLPPGTYDVNVTARNSVGLVRTDSTTNELTIIATPAAPPR